MAGVDQNPIPTESIAGIHNRARMHIALPDLLCDPLYWFPRLTGVDEDFGIGANACEVVPRG